MDLTITVTAAVAGAAFVRGNLRDANGDVVGGPYDAPVVHGAISEPFTFREPGAGRYSLDLEAFDEHSNVIDGSHMFITGIEHETTAPIVVSQISIG